MAAALAACSEVPEESKPEFIYGSGVLDGDTGSYGDGSYPALADAPSQRPQPKSLEDLEDMAGELAADRDNARYTSSQLRNMPLSMPGDGF